MKNGSLLDPSKCASDGGDHHPRWKAGVILLVDTHIYCVDGLAIALRCS